MNKIGLLPRLAVMGVRKNGSTYLPYMGISIFAVFTYFVFGLIINNDIMQTIPKAGYAMLLMSIGFYLLGIIMVPFLYYTNSFLVKRRKKELGLYSILGLEKKHIGIMMFFETALIYVTVLVCAVCLGLLFSKLLFLLLLNLAKLSVDAEFSFSFKALRDTAVFYALISAINLFSNLVQVGKANPTELMGETKKGEKEPKHILIWTLLGLLLTGWGYYLAIKAQLNSMIFTDFFLAVLLVVAGTHFLFTSGSITLLRRLKKKTGYYYRPENFITVSGMLYRMKKSAASLVNICIFSTMAIITVVCTASLYVGIPQIKKFVYPFDMEVNFVGDSFTDMEGWRNQIEALAAEEHIKITEYQAYPYTQCSITLREDQVLTREEAGGRVSFEDWYGLRLLTLDAFNQLEGTSFSLEPGEVLVFTGGPDYGREEICFRDDRFRVKEELRESRIEQKAVNNTFGSDYSVVMKDQETVDRIASLYGAETGSYKVQMNLEGSNEETAAFYARAEQFSSAAEGFASARYFLPSVEDLEAMYGGLLFIGIFFGLIFFLCLLIIMYYKQITEGFEDQDSFEIMQKVGMSDEEVRRTIKKQILMVFFLPLAGAILHTAVGINMVIKLMGAISLFRTDIIILCTLGVCVVFTILYGICYNRTARTYYRIVKRMA